MPKKNIKDMISSRRKKIDDMSGFGEEPKQAKEASYEEDFDDMASIADMEAEVKALERQYKGASKSEKMDILKKKTKLKAKIQMLKEE